MKHKVNFKQDHKKKGSISRWRGVVAKKPHFFRIILTDQHRKTLEMPVRFVNENGGSLSNSVYLKVPGSVEYWKVGLVKRQRRVWLQSGLQAFLDHHNVKCGHFLVFKYNGPSLFRVIIFDTTTTEIDYPITVSIRSGSRSHLQPISTQISTIKRDSLDDFLASSTPTNNNKSSSCTTLRRAKAYKCSEPSFTVQMRRSYVQDWIRLYLPAAHASKYLMDQHGKEVFLHRLDGETWPVQCYVNHSNARFSAGWKDFVLDNHVEEGDVCVFEMFPQRPDHYKVTIFRVGESSGGNKSICCDN